MIKVVCKKKVFTPSSEKLVFEVGEEYQAMFDGERVCVKSKKDPIDGFTNEYIITNETFHKHFYIKDPQDIVRLRHMSKDDLWQEYLQELCNKWGFEHVKQTEETPKELI